MPDFSNLGDLVNYMDKIAKEAIQDPNSETQRVMVEVGEKHVESDIYRVYTPTRYVRTGGLLNDWEFTNTNDGISMRNIRHDEQTGKDIAYTIETGKGYDFRFPFYDIPRPFTENTREELKNSSELRKAVKDDLQRKGLNVE